MAAKHTHFSRQSIKHTHQRNNTQILLVTAHLFYQPNCPVLLVGHIHWRMQNTCFNQPNCQILPDGHIHWRMQSTPVLSAKLPNSVGWSHSLTHAKHTCFIREINKFCWSHLLKSTKAPRWELLCCWSSTCVLLCLNRSVCPPSDSLPRTRNECHWTST